MNPNTELKNRTRCCAAPLGIYLAVTITLLMVTFSAQASFFQNTFGLATPQRTITFSEFSNLASYVPTGITFSNMTYNPVPDQSYPNVTPPDAGNFVPNQFAFNPFAFTFSTPQTDVAFALTTAAGGTTTFEALLGGQLVESTTRSTGFTSPNDFYGFSGITFDAIRLSVDSGDFAALVDNIQIGAVPEPATFVMPAAAAVFCIWSYLSNKRRRDTAVQNDDLGFTSNNFNYDQEPFG